MMQDVRKRIQNIHPNLLSWAGIYIDQLPDILMEDEGITHIIDGIYNEATTLLLSTDRRLIFKGIGVDDVDVIPHERIASMQYSNPMIEINAVENTFLFEATDPGLAMVFCKTVNAILGNETVQNIEDPDESVFDLLEQLGKLRENGILTHEEFTEQKKKLLEKL